MVSPIVLMDMNSDTAGSCKLDFYKKNVPVAPKLETRAFTFPGNLDTNGLVSLERMDITSSFGVGSC